MISSEEEPHGPIDFDAGLKSWQGHKAPTKLFEEILIHSPSPTKEKSRRIQ